MNFDDPLLNLATVLFAGILGGELIGRLKLPKVTGWIGTGILLRFLELPGLEPSQLSSFSPFTNFVLGFIAFTVGATLHLASLRNAGKRLALLLASEAVITPLVVGVLLVAGGIEVHAALLLAAVAIAGAPGTTVLVVREARARGILSRTLIAAVGLIDMIAVGAFVFATSLFHQDMSSLGPALLAVGAEFGQALAIGAGVSLFAVALTTRVVGPAFLAPTMVAVILGSWGLAKAMGASSILACTFAGIVLSNVRHASARSAEAYLTPIGGVLFAGFYTLAGMRLDFALVLPMASVVALYFVARLVGKWLGAYVAMRIAGVTANVRRYLGAALLPHGGVAVGLLFLVEGDPAFASIADTVVSVGLAALAINQLVGPSVTRYSLGRAGEVGQDRPRLLDFLPEQRIVVGVEGRDRQEVIAKLVDQLYATSPMEISKEEFLARVLEREEEESTCLGEGLMIPHAVCPEGQQIQGVLGLSSRGIDLGAPDGRPVHAVVLLATPAHDNQRHLAILAAFASAITHDPNLREQLYHARSAAHAYEVLHADETEDLNYFLDEAIERAGVADDETLA